MPKPPGFPSRSQTLPRNNLTAVYFYEFIVEVRAAPLAAPLTGFHVPGTAQLAAQTLLGRLREPWPMQSQQPTASMLRY